MIIWSFIYDEKVRYHRHITGKFRGASDWSYGINIQLTKKVPVIFQHLRGYDSHLIFYERRNFDVKIYIMGNGLEECMVLILNKSLVFIDSMQFVNSSFEKLVKKSSDNDFKYLTEEFGSKNLELLNKKMHIHMSTLTVLKDFLKKTYLMKNVFTDLWKMKQLTITVKNWGIFNMHQNLEQT